MIQVLLPVLSAVGSTLLSIVFKSLSKAAVERFVLLGLRKLAEHTESDVDDEIFKIVKAAIDSPQEIDLPEDLPKSPL